MSNTLRAALRYARECDWPVIPLHSVTDEGSCTCGDAGCRTPAKHPRTRRGLHDASTDLATIADWWRTWPDANIGIVTGEDAQLVAIDVDGVPPPELERLPASLVRAVTGRGGFHHLYYYRGNDIPSRTNVWPKVDVRGRGGYIVAPPSRHQNGRKYSWLPGASPFDQEPSMLPDELEAALRGPCGDAVGSTNETSVPSEPVSLSLPEVRGIEDALRFIPADDRDVWLHVGMALKSTGAGMTAYTLWADWSKTSLKFDERDQGRTWASISEYRADGREISLGTLFHLATEHGWSGGLPQLMEVRRRGELYRADRSVECDEKMMGLVEARTPIEIFASIPPELLDVPGPIGATVRWLNDTAIRPQPALSLAATLAAMGALLGQRVQSPTGLRTNIYALGVAGTGAGKEHARSKVRRLLAEAGLTELIGGEGFASGRGLVAAMQARPRCVFFVDEFGHYLASVTDKRSSSFLRDIYAELLRFYSCADSIYLGREYANPGENPRAEIDQPCLCLYGTTTPTSFFESLSSSSLRDGFFNRCIAFISDDPFPEEAEALGDPLSVPDEVTEAWREVDRLTTPGTPFGAFTVVPGCQALAKVVQLSEAAQRADKALGFEADNQRRHLENRGDATGELWIRVRAEVIKLALIRAASRSPADPLIEVEDYKWAADLVRWSVANMTVAVDGYLADSAHQAARTKVLAVVRAGYPTWLSSTEILRRARWSTAKYRNELLSELTEMGLVEARQIETSGRPRVEYRFAIDGGD